MKHRAWCFGILKAGLCGKWLSSICAKSWMLPVIKRLKRLRLWIKPSGKNPATGKTIKTICSWPVPKNANTRLNRWTVRVMCKFSITACAHIAICQCVWLSSVLATAMNQAVHCMVWCVFAVLCKMMRIFSVPKIKSLMKHVHSMNCWFAFTNNSASMMLPWSCPSAQNNVQVLTKFGIKPNKACVMHWPLAV